MGHLLHYIPVYWLFMLTDKAEYIWKVFHFGFHSIILYYIAQLAYHYFKKYPARAQMVVFVLFCNEEIREFNQLMFNDTFLAMYMIISVYYIARNQPFWASFFLTLSLSVKAGAMLMVPSFLGWLQY